MNKMTPRRLLNFQKQFAKKKVRTTLQENATILLGDKVTKAKVIKVLPHNCCIIEAEVHGFCGRKLVTAEEMKEGIFFYSHDEFILRKKKIMRNRKEYK